MATSSASPFRRRGLADCRRGLPVLAALLATLVGLSGGPPEVRAAEGGPTLPLEPNRLVTFETDEGTWMSVNVSPDGHRLVFDLLGDLYALDTAGGSAVPISRGLAFESQPVHSPDGDRLAFVSDRSGADNLWVSRPDGSDAAPISSFDGKRTLVSPAWSADGRHVYASLFRADLNGFELWRFDAVGDDAAHRVLPIRTTDDQPAAAQRSVLGVQASPDGRHLYYARHTGRFGEELPHWAIYRLDLATEREEPVVLPARARSGGAQSGSHFRPVLSPDGRTLVYASYQRGRTGLRLRELDSGADRWLAMPVENAQLFASPSLDVLPGYSFTPDGRGLVLSRNGRFERLTLDDGSAEPIPFRAEVSLEVGPALRVPVQVDDGPVRVRLIRDPEPSPDGRKLAFSALTRVYLQELDGRSPPHPLSDGDQPQFHPSWSPDGRALTFITWSAREGGRIWTAPADGSAMPSAVTSRADFYTHPVFTPDGRGIVALRSSHEQRMQLYMEYGMLREAELVMFPLDGGEPRILAAGEIGGKPHFDAAGQWVYFSRRNELVALPLAGGEPEHVVRVVGAGWYFMPGPGQVDEVRLSPAGDWALALNAHQLHLLKVPGPGGGPVQLSKPGHETRRITAVGADYFGWSDGGRSITWAVGSTFYRMPLEKALAAPVDGRTAVVLARPEMAEAFPAVVERSRDTPRGRLLIRGATAITMGRAGVISNADLLVEDNQIAAVGRRGAFAVPAGTTVIDARGKTLLPGFIDVHEHLADIRRGVTDTESWGAAANLAYGVTTSFDPSPLTIDMLEYEDLVDAGLMIGSRIHSTGPALFSFNEFQSLDEVRHVLHRYRDHYRTQNLKMYRTGNRRVRQWVAIACRELGIVPTTEGALSLKLGLTQILDGYAGHEHEFVATPIRRDLLELVAQTQVAYTPTLVISGGPGGPNALYHFMIQDNPAADPKINRFWPGFVIDQKLRESRWQPFEEYHFPGLAADAARIAAAGGLVAMGAHGNVPGLGPHWEMRTLAQGGMPPEAVLRTATLHAARAIGREHAIGSLEPGKLADLVILDRNPLEDIRHTETIHAVMKNGRLYDASTLDETWPRERAFPKPWFQEPHSGAE